MNSCVQPLFHVKMTAVKSHFSFRFESESENQQRALRATCLFNSTRSVIHCHRQTADNNHTPCTVELWSCGSARSALPPSSPIPLHCFLFWPELMFFLWSIFHPWGMRNSMVIEHAVYSMCTLHVFTLYVTISREVIFAKNDSDLSPQEHHVEIKSRMWQHEFANIP